MGHPRVACDCRCPASFGPVCNSECHDDDSTVARWFAENEYNEWPSEEDLINWNEANDYLHEDDF